MSQEKFILDATAGFRMMWSNKKHPNCIYLDVRPECEPDVIGDFRDLSQFPDQSFKLIVFDPPHRVQRHPSKTFIEKYGCQLLPETWVSDLTKAFKELWRLLEEYGILIFKWTDHDIKVSAVQQVFPSDPLFQQITSGSGRRKRATRTVWFCFMKIPKNEEEVQCVGQGVSDTSGRTRQKGDRTIMRFVITEGAQ